MGIWKWKWAQQLEWRWWRRYLGSKNRADYLSWKKAYWLRLWNDLSLTIPDHASILDAGCGPAGIHLIFPINKTWAIDPLLPEYQEHGLLFSVGYAEYLPVGLEEFQLKDPVDWIFCMNVLNHTCEPEVSMQNMYRHLRPGGRLILAVDTHRYDFVKYLFRLIPADMLHPHQWSSEDYRKLLLRCGLRIEQEKVEKQGIIFNYQLWVAVKP